MSLRQPQMFITVSPEDFVNLRLQSGKCKAALDRRGDLPYIAIHVIRSFRSTALQLYAQSGNASKLPVANSASARRIGRILRALEAASLPDHLNIPGFGLSGPNKGRYAIVVDGTWQVTFAWQKFDAVEVDLV
jgi:toxin HigB-1